MRREDFILRLIEQMGSVWARIVAALEGRDFAAARAAIDQAGEQILGLPAGAARTLPTGELVARMTFGETPEVGRNRCIALAALLRASGDLAAAARDEEASADEWGRALELMLAAIGRDPSAPLPAYAPSIEGLVAAIGRHGVPLGTRLLLLEHFERAGAYDRAEDVLFSMLDDLPGDAELLERGRAFYGRLLGLDDARLDAGGLPRAEVEAALAELDRHGR